jgi:hypothetical protein
MQTNTNHTPLVEDLLDHRAMSILYGESNTGKTFVALDIAFHIATGLPWNNKTTAQGSVIYVAAEGGLSAQHRVIALCCEHATEHSRCVLVVQPGHVSPPAIGGDRKDTLTNERSLRPESVDIVDGINMLFHNVFKQPHSLVRNNLKRRRGLIEPLDDRSAEILNHRRRSSNHNYKSLASHGC